ncbi:hypothetical protein SDJN03_00845, partial [Cucurbita argyrosperma subsp. sororia]
MLFQSLKLLEIIALQINQRLAHKNFVQQEHVEAGLESQNATVNQWQEMEISHQRAANAFLMVWTLAFAVAMLPVPKSPMLPPQILFLHFEYFL